MKRSIALLVALLLAAMPAAAAVEAFTPYDHHIKYTANGKYVVYEFPDIMLYLPIEWEDAVTVEQTDRGAAFYQTASHEKYLEQDIPGGGFLFELRASADESYRELPAFEDLGYSEDAGLHFYLLLPSDYPAWPEDADIRAAYDEMHSQIGEIVEKAKLSRSMHYYTDGIEHTDAGMS
ncbi:MAG: hypothetical protein IJJ45_07195 [Clostridia bacterium]|nr:hypothetical protein [Clostridia bacterium]